MSTRKERLTYKDKNKDNQKWYRDLIDYISERTLPRETQLKMKVNYDLFNNKIDYKEFDYICRPFGNQLKELPTPFHNRDIVSGKIKTILGMEMQRPFSYKIYSVNSEATTEKEKKEFEMIKEYVVNEIMAPIKQQLAMQAQQQQMQMQQIPPEQQEQAMQEMQQQMQEQERQMTPPEIRKYMQMQYQDPAESLSSQLLEYAKNKLDIKNKFSDMFRNGLLAARSIMYVGIVNNEPELWVINPLRFNFAKSADTLCIEDAEWAVCEYRMSPSQVASYFSKELKDKEIDAIFAHSSKYSSTAKDDDLFHISEIEEEDMDVRVMHCVWKSLRKIGFLYYIDENGEEQSTMVDEHYTLEKDLGEIRIEWEWIPEVYEGWKICVDEGIYLRMRPVPGQFKDIDNLYYCKLPYYGVIYDSYNSDETSLMDRIKFYQYFYNIVMYRLELLMASDKGKKLLMNINNVPDSLGIDLNKWQYFVESSPYIWFNPAEEGTQTQDANTVAKVMDLSLVSDIKKYMEIAEYIKQQCGKSVGITEQVEGQIGQYEAVRNTNQALIQSSYILESYFTLHEKCKVNILTALIECIKICYSKEKPYKLSYMLDDLSKHTINVEPGILDNSTLGIFVSSSSKTEKTKEVIQQLSQAALQTQTVEFSDIISILNAESVPEAEAILKTAQEKRQEALQQQQQQQQQHEQQMQQQMQEAKMQELQMQKELIVLKEEERRKTEIAKMSIMGASYNPNHDADNDGMNDFVELAKLDLQKFNDEENLKLKRDELAYKLQMANAENMRKDKVASAQASNYLQKKANRPR